MRIANRQTHLRIINLLHQGKSSRQIATELGCSKSLVNSVRLKQAENLPPPKHGGRKPLVTPRMARKLKALVTLEGKTPAQAAVVIKNEFDISISPSTVRRILHEQGLTAVRI